MRIAVWNAEFKLPASAKGAAIRELLAARDAEIVCLTEGYPGNLPAGGHLICSEADYGYGEREGRRKVLLWSRNTWAEVDTTGDPELPPGRFVRGITRTTLGELAVMGVCVPWKDAHVRSGTKDRKPWEEHERYLAGLERVLRSSVWRPLVVAGDWNQRVPRFRAPQAAAEALERTFRDLHIATAGYLSPLQRLSIDHVAHSADLSSIDVECWPEYSGDGVRLTDHFGLEVSLMRQAC